MSTFKVEHIFTGISLADYETLYFNEEFNIALCKAVKLSRDLIELEDDSNKLQRIVKVGPERKLPAPMIKVLKTERFDYGEHLKYTWGSNKGLWKTVPSILADKIKSEGGFSFEETSKGILRIVEGHIKVKIFGVGGIIEKFIIGDVEKSYNDTAVFTQQWINEHY